MSARCLVDLDRVLYVEEQPIPGAIEAVSRLREHRLALRFVTNSTADPRDRTLKELARLGLGIDSGELVNPRRSRSGTAASAATSASP